AGRGGGRARTASGRTPKLPLLRTRTRERSAEGSRMKGPQSLLDHADRMKTRMGQAFVGQRAVFRGHDLHAELRHMDWVELFVFGITGRRFGAAPLRLLHAMWVYTSYPD